LLQQVAFPNTKVVKSEPLPNKSNYHLLILDQKACKEAYSKKQLTNYSKKSKKKKN